MILSLCVLKILLISSTHSARILGLFPYKGKSHSLVMMPLLEKLSERGHDVTIFGFFPPTNPTIKYTSVSFPTRQIGTTGYLPVNIMSNALNLAYDNIVLLEKLGQEYPDVFASDELKFLEHQEFDLIIVEHFNTELFLSIVYKMKAPYILFHTGEPNVWHRDCLGETNEASYRPHIFSDLSHGRLSFLNRLKNALEVYGMIAYFDLFIRRPAQRQAEEQLGPLPQMKDITRNASLYFVNAHFTLNGVTPITPATVEVAGIHIGPKKALPNGIQRLLDNANSGAIYFSLGSVLRGTSFSKAHQNVVLNVFSQLNQTILWKFEGELENLPQNVHTASWYPQRDILAHQNVVLFISHCGVLGVHEAMTEAVPMICLPIFGDQHFNSRAVENQGFGERLDYSTLTETILTDTIVKLLHEPSYKENAVRVSNAFLDRPLSPMDTAIYWTEYVIRHKGAQHLRSSARYMSWFEYNNVDVWATVALVTLVSGAFILWTSWIFFKTVSLRLKTKRKVL